MKAALACLSLLLSACSAVPAFDSSAKDTFIGTNHYAADQLASHLRAVGQAGPIIVATFSSVDSLDETSRLGRTLSEQIGSRLVQAGFQVIEVKLRDNVYVSASRQGEFLLSREMRDISATHRVSTVIVGTYADAGKFTYVTVKAIALESSAIIASHDYTLPMVDAVRAMLPQKKVSY